MLTIKYPSDKEFIWDEDSEQFVLNPNVRLYSFEHSLKTVALWEAKYTKPFLVNDKKPIEEWIDYFVMMYQGTYPLPNDFFTIEVCEKFQQYMMNEHSATRIRKLDSGRSMIITSEVIYGYLAISGIPYDVEDWNLNRCIKLIEVVGHLKQPPKKMSQREVMEQNRRLNEERRRKYKSKG